MRASTIALAITIVMSARAAVAAEPHADLHLGIASRAGGWSVPNPQLGLRVGFSTPTVGGGLALDRTWFIGTGGDSAEPVRTRLLAALLVPVTPSTTLRLAAGAARSTRVVVSQDHATLRLTSMRQVDLDPSFEAGVTKVVGAAPVQIVFELAAVVDGPSSVELDLRLGIRFAP